MPSHRRSLRLELLFNLGFLASAAVVLVGVATLLIGTDGSTLGRVALVALWMGSIGVFVLFGAWLVRKLVLLPLAELSRQSDRLASGRVNEPPPDFDTEELAHLAERWQAMAGQLLDAQSQVVRAEKLAGIGRLAAGVAHEIRNPLGAIGTYVEVLRQRGADPAVTEGMQREIERIDRIVQGLLSYSRPGHEAGAVDLNTSVRETLAFLYDQGALRADAVILNLEEPLPAVRGDRQALDQVIVNLVLNACDALPGGRLWVGTEPRSYEPRTQDERRRSDLGSGPPPGARRSGSRPHRLDLEPGTPGVLLYVADEGPGVPEPDRERVFDPFFTTKDPGRGTGLGLAIVARTVHESGGVVWVDRAREGGAVFRIFLPAAGGEAVHPDC